MPIGRRSRLASSKMIADQIRSGQGRRLREGHRSRKPFKHHHDRAIFLSPSLLNSGHVWRNPAVTAFA